MAINIRPTIFIGLGGTGCRICTILEHRIYESKLPAQAKRLLRVLGIDSRRTPDDGVQLTDYYGLSVIPQAENVGDLINGLQTLAEKEKEPDALYFQDWYGKDKRSADVGDFIKGCGQDRVNGRVCFQAFMRYYQGDAGVPRLKQKLLNLRRELQPNAGQADGLTVEHGVDVILIGGAAGGTGSGLILDMAYLIRSVFLAKGAQAGGPPLGRLAGVVLTDQVLSQDIDCIFDQAYKSSMRENNMGCLAELDFWSQPAILNSDAISYLASWNGQEPITQGSHPGSGVNYPALDECYIVESTTGEGRGPRKAAETYRFVADFFADLYTDPGLLTQFASTSSNFSAQLDRWEGKRTSAIESARFNRLGRFKLMVPIEAIQDYLVAKLCEEALERGFEHRHSKPSDNNHFVEDQVEAFWQQHEFAGLLDMNLLRKGSASLALKTPDYSSTLSLIGDIQQFKKAVNARATSIRTSFVSEVSTDVDARINTLTELLRTNWLHAFSSFEKSERDRISARNIIYFLEEVKAKLDELSRRLENFYPEQLSWEPDAQKLKGWTALFGKWALTAKNRGKPAKVEAANWLAQLWKNAYTAYNNQAKAVYVERASRIVGNLLTQAHAITEQLTRPGSGMKSRLTQEWGRAAEAMSEDTHAMKHSLIRNPTELAKFIPDWTDVTAVKKKAASIYHRWISGYYTHDVEDENGKPVERQYWSDEPKGFASLLWSMVSQQSLGDMLEAPLNQQVSMELESRRRADLTRFQEQLRTTARRILEHEWDMGKLSSELTAWKILLTFDNPPKSRRDFEMAFKDRWQQKLSMAECLSAYDISIGGEGRRSEAEPIQDPKCLYDKKSAHTAAKTALARYIKTDDKLDAQQAFESLVTGGTASIMESSLVSPSEIVILNMSGRCFLRNFPRAFDGIEAITEDPDQYSKWLDRRFPAWVKLRNKQLPEADEEVQQRLLRAALALAWRNTGAGTGLAWNKDSKSKGADVFQIGTSRFEDFSGLFSEIPQDERCWKIVTRNLSALWRQFGLDERKQALKDAIKQLTALSSSRRDTLQSKRQSMLKAAADTVAKLLDQDDDFLASFKL